MLDIFGFLNKNDAKKQEFQQQGQAFDAKYRLKYENLHKALYEQDEHAKMDFPSEWTELKPIFQELFKHESEEFARCCICEKQLNDDYASDIEHYRPKSWYWWLAYSYENYYLSCAECNRRHKQEHFPLNTTFQATYEHRHEIHKEEPLLINPMKESPWQYFKLVIKQRPGSRDAKKVAVLYPKDGLSGYELAKATKTIEIFNLDLQNPRKTDLKKSSDSNRVRNAADLHNVIAELVEKRQNLNNQAFIAYWKQLVSSHDPIARLGLAQLILLGQFQDLDIAAPSNTD
jgi:uncharacterized protein (TIGR02646 family)